MILSSCQVELVSLITPVSLRMANSALIIPAPVIAGITGVNVVEMTLITRATMPVGLAFLSPPVGLFFSGRALLSRR
ncbi:Uncharacterised protein [Raoultella ornithinolytica]|nr:Uncharacterised protein [Raoultella ornithinolytica]